MQVHIFTTDGLYSSAFLKIIEKEPRILEHHFIFRKRVKMTPDHPPSFIGRISYSTNIFSLILRTIPLLYKADWIYFHYLPYGPSLLIWSILPKIIRKSTWIIWGGDVTIYKEKNKNLKNQFYENLRKIIIPKFREIASFIEDDSIEAMNIYNFKPIYNQILYPIPVNQELLSSYVENENNSYISILIGNSGDSSNCHIEALSMIERFKLNAIKVYCPLAYHSDYQYVDKVIKYGYMMLGKQFFPMTDLLSVSEYSNFLKNINVAIMNHKRQQGLGNILPLLYLGKKVFIRNDISTYKFLKKMGCVINSIDELKKMSYRQFVKMDSNHKNNNKKIISLISSEDYSYNLWHKLFIRHYDD